MDGGAVCGVARGAWGCEVSAVRRLPIVTEDRPGVVRVRARTENMHRLSQRALRAGAEAYPEQPGVDYLRPQTFADCESVGLGDITPCPFVSCKHHLYLDVNPRTGSIKLNFPDREVDELPATCALRVAEQGGATLEDVADIIGVVRERIRQVQDRALAQLRGVALAAAEDLDD